MQLHLVSFLAVRDLETRLAWGLPCLQVVENEAKIVHSFLFYTLVKYILIL